MENREMRLGLRENWAQFTILVIVNAFVGGMVELERAIFPKFAGTVFGIASAVAILSFITAFGFPKAITNYFTGRLANKFGRRRLLILGWGFALPVPFLLMWAPSWGWVVFANVLLGWGLGQLFTGKLSDILAKKRLLFWGMVFLAAALGLGTALVYPTFLAAIAEATAPMQRAESIGVFRLWRDLGYALGAILSGIIADAWGLDAAIFAIGGLTLFSALVIWWRMPSWPPKAAA